jgi:hypothetical protein
MRARAAPHGQRSQRMDIRRVDHSWGGFHPSTRAVGVGGGWQAASITYRWSSARPQTSRTPLSPINAWRTKLHRPRACMRSPLAGQQRYIVHWSLPADRYCRTIDYLFILAEPAERDLRAELKWRPAEAHHLNHHGKKLSRLIEISLGCRACPLASCCSPRGWHSRSRHFRRPMWTIEVLPHPLGLDGLRGLSCHCPKREWTHRRCVTRPDDVGQISFIPCADADPDCVLISARIPAATLGRLP